LDFAFQTLISDYELFIVIDADTTVTPNLVRDFATACMQGADSLQCRYKVRNADDSIRTRWMNIALMAFNVLRPRGRSRFGVSAGVLGNGFALTRATLEKVPYHATSVVEDLEYHLRLVRARLKVQFVDTVTVFGEMPITGKGVLTQRSRWEGGRLRMMSQLAPALLHDLFRGQVRLLEPLLELSLLPLAFHATLLTLALATPVPVVREYTACALAIVLLHLLSAIAIGGGQWRDLLSLFSAPFYVVWKLKVIPELIRNAGKGTPWVRTARAESKGGVQ
jgi:cellulose synthase/poly-beta-1,6-N-acetylglucosamine synthase-like glycosyltransferase